MIKNKGSIAIAVIAIVSLIIGFVLAGVSRVEPPLGKTVHNVQETFDAGIAVDGIWFIDEDRNLDVNTLVQGGSVGIIGYGTTTATAAQVCDYSVIRIGLLADAVATLTLPTAALINADCLETDGDSKTVLIDNEATSTLALTIVAGTGIDLQEHVGEGDVVIAATEYARIRFTRVTSATTTAEVINLQAGD